jgi:hypothetical protein
MEANVLRSVQTSSRRSSYIFMWPCRISALILAMLLTETRSFLSSYPKIARMSYYNLLTNAWRFSGRSNGQSVGTTSGVKVTSLQREIWFRCTTSKPILLQVPEVESPTALSTLKNFLWKHSAAEFWRFLLLTWWEALESLSNHLQPSQSYKGFSMITPRHAPVNKNVAPVVIASGCRRYSH